MDKEVISDKFFGGCKSRELKTIEYITPKGNNVKALICRKHNKYLGSMYIYEVNNEKVEQFVPSMPKIHYLDKYHTPHFELGTSYLCKEKLDGTCVILYALKDHNGEVLEIVPKSRNMGVLDKQFMKKFELIDTLYIEEYLWKHPKRVLLFELYGMGNLHSIKHMSTYLNLGFIGYYDDNGMLKYDEVLLPFYNNIPFLFSISYGSSKYSVANVGLGMAFAPYVKLSTEKYDTIEECINWIQTQLEDLNNKYFDVNHRLAIEGVVLNYKDHLNNHHYLKIKPFSIEKEHRSEGGIPRQFIMKEMMKYFDEYGSVVKEEYEKSSDHYLEYMKRQLSEEFDELSIKKSEKKMITYLEKRLYPKPKNEKIVEICNQLLREYPNKELVEYMRLFGQQYPNMKKHSGNVYTYFEEVL